MATTPTLMTVEQFRQIPEPVGDFDYELHRGELVKVTRPKHKHIEMQRHLRGLLEKLLGDEWIVVVELPFCVLENDLRVADVGVVSAERWRNIRPDENLAGAPDIVIEILSPSNTAAEMYDREHLCLEYGGGREFWTIDLDRRQVRVATGTSTRVYREGMFSSSDMTEEMPVLTDKWLTVDDIFAQQRTDR